MQLSLRNVLQSYTIWKDEKIKKEFLENIEKEGVVKDKCYLSSWDEEKKEIVAIFGNLPKSYDELEASYQCDKE